MPQAVALKIDRDGQHAYVRGRDFYVDGERGKIAAERGDAYAERVDFVCKLRFERGDVRPRV